MKRHSNNIALDYAEMLAEKEKIDKKIKKLELNQRLRNGRRKNKNK